MSEVLFAIHGLSYNKAHTNALSIVRNLAIILKMHAWIDQLELLLNYELVSFYFVFFVLFTTTLDIVEYVEAFLHIENNWYVFQWWAVFATVLNWC